VAVRSATEDCCPEAFTHLMEDFPEKAGTSARAAQGDACQGEKR
jgi:hypothetical protein